MDIAELKNKVPIDLIRILETFKKEKPSDLIFNPITGKGKHEIQWKSSDFRQMMYNKEVICMTKSGLIMTPNEAKSLYLKIKKIKCIWNRNSLLRLIHGDIWYNSKLFITGLLDSNTCSRCDMEGSLMHTIFECESIKTLWYEIKGLFYLTGENYEIFSQPNLNHLLLALIAQLIYNRIRITPEENKKYTSDEGSRKRQ